MSMVKKKNDHLASFFELVRDTRKDELFNQKKHLLHCVNGVYDLKKGKFHKAKPSDYSKMSTKITYLDYDEHPQEKKALVEKFLNDFTLDNEEHKKFLLKALSSALSSNNEDQQFYFFDGSGNNAKSTLIKLMKKVLGDYGTMLPTAQVPKPNLNAQAASPSLMALLFKRGGFLTKLEEKTLYTEFLKMTAGGDSTSGQQLHNEQREIDLWVKIFIAVNDLLQILDKTNGFWQKVIVIPCNARFVHNPDPEKPEERPLVDGFTKQILDCANTFLALLVKTYITDYKTEGVKKNVHPDDILERVEKYRVSQNIPLQFISNMIEPADDTNAVLVKTLDMSFTEFCKDKAFTKTPQLVRQVYELMDSMFPPSNSKRQIWIEKKNLRGWKGAMLKKDEESEEESEEEKEEIAISYEEVEKDFLHSRWAGA
ncbi:uncharacterized protein SPPG_07199 [Spizellomyces punctatus DAOM BR117]|uniref:SF3 helicase domain-containing protein n=1 Tax=Spizellomyces punctatus (strain DAOM BR117) TaxID=645134 RepID=A0A0L0H7S1_SPIPD|nr:uncharacterized protein SPPG_07199 [Spizellomyces punctatus DAOM BR117]KNC97272.1 hypothetical protein SPPG_07199 [Spizellomyces punctatus DAOM BR117]|eukprot:XP_016605312.1 hypothetical protein SPPG_07199 [Spizellomyces punctatus DAOM BR117]